MGGTLFTALAAYSGCTAARWYLDRSSRRDTDCLGGRVRLKSLWNEGAAFGLPIPAEGLPLEETGSTGHGDNTAVTRLTFDGEKLAIDYELDNSHLTESISTLARQAWWRKDKTKAADVNLWGHIPLRSWPQERELYLKLRRELCPDVPDGRLLQEAEELWQASPGGMWNINIFYAGERPMGVTLYDMDRDKEEGAGYIKFLSILPEDRGRKLGIQLIGAAVSMYRNSGRDRLRLHCPAGSERARRFFQTYGFVKLREDREGDLLEKYIGYEW